MSASDHETWLTAVMATGPPEGPFQRRAVERHTQEQVHAAAALLTDLLSATIVG